jgi:hypothetical protein
MYLVVVNWRRTPESPRRSYSQINSYRRHSWSCPKAHVSHEPYDEKELAGSKAAKDKAAAPSFSNRLRFNSFQESDSVLP